MKKGRRKDHNWVFVRYKGDLAIYAKCSCGFHYSCCHNKREMGLLMVPAPDLLYPYCPICGSRKTTYDDEVRKIDHYVWE